MFRQTPFQEPTRRDVDMQGLVALHGKRLVAPRTQGAVHPTPPLDDASQGPTPDLARALPEGTLGLTIGFPIGKKEDMACLLLHDELKRLDEAQWEKAGISGQRKQGKGKKSIKTLAVPPDAERPIPRPLGAAGAEWVTPVCRSGW